MDVAGLRVPLDFESWQELRVLKAKLGSAALAGYAYLRLWVELGYQVQTTGRLGFLSAEAAEMFGSDMGNVALAFSMGERGVTGSVLDVLASSGVLVRVEGGWECPRFVKCNPHLDPAYLPAHKKGAEASRYVRDLRKYDSRAMQEALLIPAERWVKPGTGSSTEGNEGNEGPQGLRRSEAMTSEEIKRVMMLVRALDGALGRRDRVHNGADYPEGLIADAWLAVRDYPAETLQMVCKWLLNNRGRPAVPGTAEQVLARFSEVASAAARE